ncbi:MAG: Mur ligase family protein, partial [Planctomycetota bacterium]|nr:Mur ligase family protein [Planctomycetota bacterium]
MARFGGELVQRAQDGWAGDPDIQDVDLDSRTVAAGSLFCALRGSATDGRRFLRPALGRGAAAVLCDDLADLPELARGWRAAERDGGGLRVATSALWLHPNPRRITGLAADLVHGSPSSATYTVGITGTNGKTSVAHLVHQLLELGGLAPSLFGTVQHSVHGMPAEVARTTTPEATYLHRALARAAAAGSRAAVLEVSSHAVHQSRVAGLAFDVGVFTNLTRDHLDYHGSLEEYAAVKASFFRSLGPDSHAVVNADDAHGEQMAAAAR